MKILSQIVSLILFVVLHPGSLVAQTADDYHPVLSKKFYLGAGAYFPDKNFKIRVAGTANPSREIDFEEALKIDNSETTGAAETVVAIDGCALNGGYRVGGYRVRGRHLRELRDRAGRGTGVLRPLLQLQPEA